MDYPFAPPSACVQKPWNETAAALTFCYFKPPVLLETKGLAGLETVVLLEYCILESHYKLFISEFSKDRHLFCKYFNGIETVNQTK